jgi:amidophosphoribosyltransferase
MCGIVGVYGVRKAIELAVVGAHQLQHRARTFAGAVSSDSQNFYRHAGEGLARNVFSGDVLRRLHGKDAVVHLRYPTVGGESDRDNTQPVLGIYGGKQFALAHNGNLTNVDELKPLLPRGTQMTTTLDSEYIVRLLEHMQTDDFEEDLVQVCSHLKGSYSLVILLPGRMIALRDKSGNRPLSVATLGDGYVVASENCAFPSMGAASSKEIAPGSMVVIDERGLETRQFEAPMPRKCVFELLYNGSVASTVFGVSVNRFRLDVGERLGRMFPVSGAPVDVVVTPVPDSGIPYAQGYANGTNPSDFFQVIWRNHYVGRTFNAATQGLRDEEVARKFIFNPDEIRDKSVAVLDDSIVRGTTLPKIVAMLRHLGAREVHARIGTPPIKFLCRYGIYMDEDETDLVAAAYDTAALAKKFGATSLEFLPLDALRSLMQERGQVPDEFCFACMDGAYW